MLKRIFILLGTVLLVVVAVLLFNSFRAKPWPIANGSIRLQPLPDSAIRHLSEAVQIPTVSYGETAPIDTAAFSEFATFLERSYPLVGQHLSRTRINQFNYIYQWKGQDSSLAPVILMGHYDVVPVEPAAVGWWIVPPFSGKITDTCIWGRGSVDDKNGVISELEATEAMLRKGFVPRRTIYLCFGHDEEISGKSAAAVALWFEQKKIRPEMVLDEGGEISESKIKEVNRPIAVIAVAEKGYASFELSVEKEGGHSSMPVNETAIDILITALHTLRSKTPPSRITPPVQEFLSRISANSDNFLHKLAGSNTWLFEGISKGIISSKPEGAAMIHTTIVPTILQSGVKDNIIPGTAKAIVNSRILPGETAKSVENYIRDLIGDDRVRIKKISSFDSDPSATTDLSSPAHQRIERAVQETVPMVIPTPYLNIGATDSRYFRRISDGVINFLPTTDSKGYHGINERLPIRDFQRTISFMMTIIEETNKEFR
jgi:carboxypeptidase PM20D1